MSLCTSIDPCQDDQTDRMCNYNSAFDTSTDCVSTTLNCVNSICEAAINELSRGCQFMNITANVSQPIHCCLCSTSTTGPFMGQLIWGCSITTPSSLSLLPSGEYTNYQAKLIVNLYNATCHAYSQSTNKLHP